MQTPEGADDAEIIVRPRTGGGFQVGFPSSTGFASRRRDTEQEALALARSLGPDMQVRFLLPLMVSCGNGHGLTGLTEIAAISD